MKKTSIILSLLLICNASLFAKSEGIVLQNNATLWDKDADGVVCWTKNSTSVQAGTILEVVSEKTEKHDLKTSKSLDKNIEFYNVNYDGKSLYILANRFVLGNDINIVKKDSALYTKPAVNAFRNAYLEPCTIVVKLAEVSTSVCSFAKIAFFDEKAYTIRERYILTGNISSDRNDIKVVQILDKINEVKDEKMKQELIKNAVSLSTTEEISNIVNAKYNEIYGIAEESNSEEAVEYAEETEDVEEAEE